MSKDGDPTRQFNGIYEDLALLIGIDSVIKIYDLFKGQQITFPKRLFSQDYVVEQIVKVCHDSPSIKAMATKYGYTERWVRTVLKKHIEDVE